MRVPAVLLRALLVPLLGSRGEVSPSSPMLPYTPGQPTTRHFRLPPLRDVQSPPTQRSRLKTRHALVFHLALSFRALHPVTMRPNKICTLASSHKILFRRMVIGSFVLVPTRCSYLGHVVSLETQRRALQTRESFSPEGRKNLAGVSFAVSPARIFLLPSGEKQ